MGIRIVRRCGNKLVDYDLSELRVTDGRLAHTLSHTELLDELLKTDVPVNAHMGAQQMLELYAEYLAETGNQGNTAA